MALFGRKNVPPAGEPSDHRSKRGGARRPTQEVQIDLSELERRAAPAPGLAPTPKPGAPAAPRPAGPQVPQSTRRSGRPGRRGTPIGELLVKVGAVNTEQLTKALRTQEEKGGLVGQVLREMGACTDDDVGVALAKQFRFTQVDLATFEPTPESLMLVPPEKCREFKIVPFECVGEYVCVAMVNVLNRKGLTQAENLAKLKVKGFTCSWAQIQATIDKCYTPEVTACAQKIEEARAGEGGRPADIAKKLAAELTGAAAVDAGAGASKKESTRRKKSHDLKASVRAAPAKPPADVEAERYTAAAEALRSQGRIEDALKRLEAGAAAVPESGKLQAMLAKVRAEVEKKRTEEAERHRRVAELVGQGRALREAGDTEGALASFGEATKLEPDNKVIQREVSVTQNAIARAKGEEVARRKAEEEARAAEERRGAAEEVRRKSQVSGLMEIATEARKGGDLAVAAARLEDVLALDPEHADAKKLSSKVKKGGATAADVDTVLRMVAEDREAGRLEVARRKLAGAAEAHADREDVAEALEQVEADIEKRSAEEEKRLAAEDEKLRKAEDDLRERASALAEAGAERRRTESVAASGGERRLEAGTIEESTLVTFLTTPDEARAALSKIVASRLDLSPDDALAKLPVAQIYSRSREDLRKLAEAASAVDAALADIEEEVLVPDAGELGLELEPALEPQPPMPELEEQLDAEAEVLEAEAVEEDEDAEIAEAEVLEAEPERLDAVRLSEKEYKRLEPDLEPDPIQDWYVVHAAGGPVPAVPAED